ncbi:hypothetical protein CSOJ01_03448 [Colletotrichum sojae]|uniref:Uncharacterized protein n=1 Tax=Colletotrichum sojae TaxID=2175907 RepID=A0A8H6JMZ0_9PEZI|nr:hypothetical protein CSOJ01_03448 [Colletotrichum sojae]
MRNAAPNTAATDRGPFGPDKDRVDNPQRSWRNTSRWPNMFGHQVSCCGLWLLPPFDDPRIWHGTQHTNIAADVIVPYLAQVEAALPLMGFFKLVSLVEAPLAAPAPTCLGRESSRREEPYQFTTGIDPAWDGQYPDLIDVSTATDASLSRVLQSIPAGWLTVQPRDGLKTRQRTTRWSLCCVH